MTPPVAPKIVPAPVYSPRIESGWPSSRARNSMPDCLSMRASSRVVRATSTSLKPEAYISSVRDSSYFFAVQGMIDTTYIFERVHAELLRVIGLRQDAEHLLGRLRRGEVVDEIVVVLLHEVRPGRAAGGDEGQRGPRLWTNRSMNSLASSTIVRSAEKLVSKTAVKPRRRRAA